MTNAAVTEYYRLWGIAEKTPEGPDHRQIISVVARTHSIDEAVLEEMVLAHSTTKAV